MPEEVLTFWFEDIEPRNWWAVDPEFDRLLKDRFLPLLLQAAAGELFAWRTSARGRLAEIIVLDQFSRNIHRGTRQAYSQDPQALILSQEAVAGGALNELTPAERTFLLMPYMHSESRVIHAQAEALFRDFTPADNYQFELRHKAIVDRFGRYPHRNAILGRTSSEEETGFLNQPDSGF
jgi:uncharacterized protein (DUF924 family)